MEITLPFKPREYQLPLMDALENKGYKRILCIMPRRCLDGNTHITMADGSFRYLKDIQEGDSVLSWDGTKFVPDKVIGKWSTGIKKTRILQGSKKQPKIISSYDHRFAVSYCGREDVNWKEANEIGLRQQLQVYAGIPLHGESNNDLAEFLGYMCSDGYIAGYQQPKFTNMNKEILERVESLALSLFGYVAIWRQKGYGWDLGLSNGTKGGGAYKNKVKELFRSDDGQVYPKSKRRLPKECWEFDEESIIRFFAGVISGDGSIYVHTQGFQGNTAKVPPAGEIKISCGVSELLAWDYYWLLRKIGIIPCIPRLDKISNWQVRISTSTGIKKLLSCGPIYGKQVKQKDLLEHSTKYERSFQISKGCYRSRCGSNELFEERELFDIETENHHNFVANGYLVHNSGKDVCAFNVMVRQALRRVGYYMYIFPYASQARKVIYDAITNEGKRFLDYIPPELIARKNSTEMKITLKNGSIIQLAGSDSVDSLMGTNPIGIIFSEYALQDPLAYQFLRPILLANDGWSIMISTPRGRNHMYTLYQIAMKSKDWFVYRLTLADTRHISQEDIQKEIDEGIMSDDLIQQEYNCSFDRGVSGSVYDKYIQQARLDGRIGDVPYDTAQLVHTAWDLGIKDPTVIIFFQVMPSGAIRIINYHEKSDSGFEYFAKYLQSLPYTYGKHIAPFDIKVRELGTGMSRIDRAADLGIQFVKPNELDQRASFDDGIVAVQALFSKLYIDERNCKRFIKHLETYHYAYDEKYDVYSTKVVHDNSSHSADALRYLALSMRKLQRGMTQEDVDRMFAKNVYGTEQQFPEPLRKPTYNDGTRLF